MTFALPAHLEVTGLMRAVEAAGGFAMVLRKGQREAGAILVVLMEKGANARVYERIAQLDGSRGWTLMKVQDAEKPHEIDEYLTRRADRDPDLWIVELDIVNGERFIRLTDDNG